MRIISVKGNSYNYDPKNRSLTYIHPLIIKFNQLEKIEGILSLNDLKKKLPEYSKKEIDYYYGKYNLIKEKLHIPFDFNNQHNLRIDPKDIIFQLANIRQVVFEVTDACNLKCHYCGYGGLYNFYDKRESSNLTFSKAKVLINYLSDLWKSSLHTSSNKRVHISFYGGEPLLNVRLIEDIITYLQSKSLYHIQFVFTMTTNAVYLRKEIDFLIKNDIHVLISLDGNSINHSYRIFKNGKNSFNLVYANIKYVQKTYPEYFKKNVGFNAVLHNRNSVKDIFDFITSEFDKTPQIGELNTMGVREDRKKEFMHTYRNTVESLHQAEDYFSIEKEMFANLPGPRNLTYFLHQYTDNVYKKYSDFFLNKNSYRYLPTGTCFPFSRKLFVTVSGKILACERIPHEFALGQVNDDSLDLDVERIAEQYNAYYDKMERQCSRCYRRNGCVQCIFYLKNLNKRPVCDGFFGVNQLQMQMGEAISSFENENYLYHKIMKDIIID